MEALVAEAEQGYDPAKIGPGYVRSTYDPNRWQAQCRLCSWTSVSTGPQARTRLRKLAAKHRCLA